MKRRRNWSGHILNFLAVILGVYLAFYMNERAKANSDRAEGVLLMEALVADLSDDIQSYAEYQIPLNEQHLENVGLLLSALATDSADAPISLGAIFEVQNFSPTTATYSSMKSSGKLRLIDDLTMRKNLTSYYEGLVLESVAKGEYQVDYFTDELLAWLTLHADLSVMALTEDADRLVLLNKLIIYQSLIDQKVESYRMLVEQSQEIKAQIEGVMKSDG